MKKYRKPNKVQVAETEWLRAELTARGLYPMANGYDAYVVDGVRGRCYYTKPCFTIPLWAVRKSARAQSIHQFDPLYFLYYACHEMAHSLTPRVRGQAHGKEFMKNFRKLCPPEIQHYELQYKPRNAAAAGISK